MKMEFVKNVHKIVYNVQLLILVINVKKDFKYLKIHNNVDVKMPMNILKIINVKYV